MSSIAHYNVAVIIYNVIIYVYNNVIFCYQALVDYLHMEQLYIGGIQCYTKSVLLSAHSYYMVIYNML